MNSDEDKRQAQRLPLRAYAQVSRADRRWDAHVLDISLTGARIAILEEHPFTSGMGVKLTVEFIDTGSDSETLLMHGLVVHTLDHVVGLDLEPNSTADRVLLERLLDKLADTSTPSPPAPPPAS